MGEGAAHRAFYEEYVGNRAQGSKTNFIFDYIPNQRSLDAIAGFRPKLMPVMPLPEPTFLLNVIKVMVPFEFGDASDPLRPQRREGKQAGTKS